jgi:hypothetical protein
LIFVYNSVSFLHPEVFTKRKMRPGRHGHRVRVTGGVRAAWCTWVTQGGRWGVGRGGAVSTGVDSHGRIVPGPSSGNGHWAGRWARQDFGRVGRFQSENRIRPMAIRENKKYFISKAFIICKPIRIQIKFKCRMTSIRKINYKSTSSHNKICSGMNATSIFIK